MIGDLTKDQCAQVLYSAELGRLGCYSARRMYIVPVSYVFDGTSIYIHSKEGQKINMMRKNPSVCFQVDRIESFVSWRSVIVWGTYEELGKREQTIAMKILRDRLGPLKLSAAVRPPKGFEDSGRIVNKPVRAVAFRINIAEMTGKFERI